MSHSEYHIVVFPGAMSTPRRFRIKRRTVSILLISSLIAAVLQIAFLAQYISRSGEIWELETLRSEAAQRRQQATALSLGMEEIRKQLSNMREINGRLRMMLGLDSPKPSPSSSGLGGKEESDPATAPGMGGERAFGDRSFSEVASQLSDQLAWLKQEALNQEHHMQELAGVVGEKKVQWAATPSIWPVRGWVSSKFGHRISPFTGQDTMHGGIDISAPMSTPVLASAAGTVVVAEFEAGLGNAVIVSHGYGVRTTYGHLAKIKVMPGQSVKRGDVVGWVGSTGLSTGPHLHYEVEHKGSSVDPMKYIID
jgi:murein DD-endopeptidase MepM/ murein hydrolase activator NlpD